MKRRPRRRRRGSPGESIRYRFPNAALRDSSQKKFSQVFSNRLATCMNISLLIDVLGVRSKLRRGRIDIGPVVGLDKIYGGLANCLFIGRSFFIGGRGGTISFWFCPLLITCRLLFISGIERQSRQDDGRCKQNQAAGRIVHLQAKWVLLAEKFAHHVPMSRLGHLCKGQRVWGSRCPTQVGGRLCISESSRRRPCSWFGSEQGGFQATKNGPSLPARKDVLQHRRVIERGFVAFDAR